MNKILKGSFGAAILFALTLPFDVYANSSWVWISERRPYDVLPVVAVITVIIEICMIKKMAQIKNDAVFRLCSAVIISNLLSFAFPYIIYLYTAVNENIYTFPQFMESLPTYTVGAVFLAMTLAVEIPAVFLTMRKKAVSAKMLILSIVLSNTATTALTALTERIISPGHW